MKSTKTLPRSVLHDELLGMMRTQAREDVREELRRVLGAALGNQPILYRALVHGCVVQPPDDKRHGIVVTENAILGDRPANGAPVKHKAMSAGRARQIKAMRAYWARRRAQKGRK